jgi:hypothetical protein
VVVRLVIFAIVAAALGGALLAGLVALAVPESAVGLLASAKDGALGARLEFFFLFHGEQQLFSDRVSFVVLAIAALALRGAGASVLKTFAVALKALALFAVAGQNRVLPFGWRFCLRLFVSIHRGS